MLWKESAEGPRLSPSLGLGTQREGQCPSAAPIPVVHLLAGMPLAPGARAHKTSELQLGNPPGGRAPWLLSHPSRAQSAPAPRAGALVPPLPPPCWPVLSLRRPTPLEKLEETFRGPTLDPR